MSNTLQGKCVFITGASSGIGEATARRLHAEGSNLALFARREARLKKLAAELDANVLCITGDVLHQDDLLNAAEMAREKFGKIDVLVNNAGVMPLSLLAERRVSEWDRMIDVNIKGVLYAIDAVLADMLAKESGHIINISSVAGWHVNPATSVYSATKFAVRAISEGLRKEAGGKLRVTTIYPGIVETELLHSVADPNFRQNLDQLMEQHAMPASSIADAIFYALSQPSSVGVNDIIIAPPSMN